ncbi:hypothetical protein ACLKA7_007759 [Drosophila subpalustris]
MFMSPNIVRIQHTKGRERRLASLADLKAFHADSLPEQGGETDKGTEGREYQQPHRVAPGRHAHRGFPEFGIDHRQYRPLPYASPSHSARGGYPDAGLEKRPSRSPAVGVKVPQPSQGTPNARNRALRLSRLSRSPNLNTQKPHARNPALRPNRSSTSRTPSRNSHLLGRNGDPASRMNRSPTYAAQESHANLRGNHFFEAAALGDRPEDYLMAGMEVAETEPEVLIERNRFPNLVHRPISPMHGHRGIEGARISIEEISSTTTEEVNSSPMEDVIYISDESFPIVRTRSCPPTAKPHHRPGLNYSDISSDDEGRGIPVRLWRPTSQPATSKAVERQGRTQELTEADLRPSTSAAAQRRVEAPIETELKPAPSTETSAEIMVVAPPDWKVLTARTSTGRFTDFLSR